MTTISAALDPGEMPLADLADEIVEWLHRQVVEGGVNGLALGVSEGADAATCLALALRAVGAPNVSALVVRTVETDEQCERSLATCAALGVVPTSLDLRDTYRAFVSALPEKSDRTLENLRDRIRAAAICHIAVERGQVVIGTVNRNEFMLGYFTKQGSALADLTPLVGLFKSRVVELARFLGVPEAIATRTPAGDGPSVSPVNKAETSVAMQEHWLIQLQRGEPMPPDDPVALMVERRVRASEHKRKMPPGYSPRTS